MSAEPDRGSNRARFPLGSLVATPGAIRVCTPGMLRLLVSLHSRGNWGPSLCPEDKAENDRALAQGGGRLLSSYEVRSIDSQSSETVWIITEADRSVTTILLREEY
jgi:hypothetical protein